MQKTAIQWTDRSANTIRARHKTTGKVGWHCVMHSPGCLHCYSQNLNGRLGTRLPYTKRSGEEVELFLDLSPFEKARRFRKPQRIFINDMTDMFADFVPDDWLDQMFACMAIDTRNTYQILTKRPERMQRYFASRTLADVYTEVLRGDGREPAFKPSPLDHVRSFIRTIDHFERSDKSNVSDQLPREWPLQNVWLGTSVENQQFADKRVIYLLNTPAAVRFLSVEPLLGRVDLTGLGEEGQRGLNALTGEFRYYRDDGEPCTAWGTSISWVIVGGESGRSARPCSITWIRRIVRDCRQASVPVFVKQWGANPIGEWGDDSFPTHTLSRSTSSGLTNETVLSRRWKLRDSKGGYMAEWPKDIQVREMPLTEGLQ